LCKLYRFHGFFTTAQAAQQTAQGAARKGDDANQGVQQANIRITSLENRVANLGDNYAESGKTTAMFPPIRPLSPKKPRQRWTSSPRRLRV
jgi:hypothetical protein